MPPGQRHFQKPEGECSEESGTEACNLWYFPGGCTIMATSADERLTKAEADKSTPYGGMQGDPGNTGICVACFIRDISKAPVLHRAAAVIFGLMVCVAIGLTMREAPAKAVNA